MTNQGAAGKVRVARAGRREPERQEAPARDAGSRRAAGTGSAWPRRARAELAHAGRGARLAALGAAGLVAWWSGLTAGTPALVLVAAGCALLAVVDARTHRLPDAVLLPVWAVATVLLALAALLTGDGPALVRALCGALFGFGAFAALRLVHPPGLGFGDVKLAGLLGTALAWLGWAELVVGLVAPFVLGGVWAVALLALRRATRSTAVPFGPFMVLGAGLAAVGGDAVVRAYGLA
ncbi:A24 family peptidase [Cellulosimicrobium sp. PMB13]|uniref:prepilin peptidase n=1 Tax=Cellulosimicrobium sp. PMB13 TaxID=3120158 RepID=UPI003F4B412D